LTARNGPGRRPLRAGRARDQLLARAALAEEQHGRVGRGDGLDDREDLAHGARLADDALEAAGGLEGLLERAVAGQEPAPLDGAGGDQRHALRARERPGQVVVGAEAHGLHGGRDAAVGGHHDHRQVGPGPAHALEQLQAVHLGHVQVGEDAVDAGGVGPERGQGLGAAARRPDLEAGLAQQRRDGEQQRVVVVDDHDGAPRRALLGHARLS
jgi:hypothetical protein